MNENTKNTIISAIIFVGLIGSISATAFAGYLLTGIYHRPEPTMPPTYTLMKNQFGEYKVVCKCGHEVSYGYSGKRYTIKIAVSDWKTHRKQHETWEVCK